MNIQEILQPVKEVLLDGHKFPNGKQFNHKEMIKELEISIPTLVLAYNSLDRSKDYIYLPEIYYLARSIDWDVEHSDIEGLVNEDIRFQLLNIAKEGRHLSLAIPPTFEERLGLAKLYKSKYNEIFAAQLKDPKRGCSASVCTNCDEPNAFADYKCNICGYELIQARGMPILEEFKEASATEKYKMLSNGYSTMVKRIIESGDWRSGSSSLNRLKSVYALS